MRQGTILAIAVLATAILACGEAALANGQDEKTVTVANLNIFHGIDCALVEKQRGEQITQCRLPKRIDLLFEHLAAIGCPDIVTLQEIVTREFVPITATGGCVGPLDDTVVLIEEGLPSLAKACGFTYGVVFDHTALRNPLDLPCMPGRGIDEELILSRYPIKTPEIRLLHSALYVPGQPLLQFFARHVLFVRIDHPVGPIDVFTTHLAASEDFGDNPCDSQVDFGNGFVVLVPCPAECDGAKTVRQCEARQVANFVKELHDVSTSAFITGDFNAKPHSAVYKEITKAENHRQDRWIDSYLAADNRECNRHTGIGCTAGRVAIRPDGTSELEERDPNVDERIDYIFVVPSAPELECNIQEKGTGLFADEPNPECLLNSLSTSMPICWASDHNGTRANLSCEHSADRDLSLASW